MPSTLRSSRALFAVIFTLLLAVAGLYAATATYAQSGLTIVVDHVDATGWRAHVEGTCPDGYELQTRALEGRWTDDDTGTMIRAHCYRPSDGFECWHVTKWVSNPNYIAPTSTPLPIGAPTATPTPPPPTATPCPDCPVPTATTLPSLTPEGTVGATATPPAPSGTPQVPPIAPDAPVVSPDTGTGVAPGPCPNNPNGMPVRWVYRDGRDEPICEEIAGGAAPAPAATVVGSCFVRGNTAMARFDVNLVEGEVARAEYLFSDGTRQLVLDAPFSPDEERPALPNPLEVAVPNGQTVTLNLIVVGYDDHITVTSNAVDGACAMLPPPGAPAGDGGGQVVGDVVSGPAGGIVEPVEAIGTSGDQLGQEQQGRSALPAGRAAATDVEAAQVIPRALPRTAGEAEYPGLWLLGALLLLAGGVVRLRAARR